MKKVIRNQLEEISLKSYGTKNAYRKVKNLTGYQIPTGIVPQKATKRQVIMNGVIYNEETAVKKFGFEPEPVSDEPKSKIVYRGPSDEELVFMMDRAYQDMVVSVILTQPEQPHDPTFVLAYLYKNERLTWDIRLTKSSESEEYTTAVNELLTKVSKEDTDKFNSWLINDGDKANGAIDYEEFLNELTSLTESSDLTFNEMFAVAEGKRNLLLAEQRKGA